MNKLLATLLFSATCAFAAQSFAADTGAAQVSTGHMAKKSTHAPAHHQKAAPKKGALAHSK
jgi:hypothetical protein